MAHLKAQTGCMTSGLFVRQSRLAGGRHTAENDKTMEKKIRRLGNIINNSYTGMSYAGNVFDRKGLCQTLRVVQGGYAQPLTVKKYAKKSSKDARRRGLHGRQQGMERRSSSEEEQSCESRVSRCRIRGEGKN